MNRPHTTIPCTFCGILLLLFAACGPIENPQNSAGLELVQSKELFQQMVYKGKDGAFLPLRLFVPNPYDKSREYPLVLYLHNAAARGTDNQKQITGSSYAGTHIWTTAENQAKYPCFVMVPQCGKEHLWSDPNADELSPKLKEVLEALVQVGQQYRIDPDRIYVVGVSMGGSGAWELVIRNPNLFAAAVPVGGIADIDKVEDIVGLPVWAFNDAQDPTTDTEWTRDLMESLYDAGGKPLYTEYAGTGQNIEDRVFNEPNLLQWLFSQKRGQ